ncbi:hypothetical protein LG293_16285 (plasmid) [Citricoccus nitrophenolicus]
MTQVKSRIGAVTRWTVGKYEPLVSDAYRGRARLQLENLSAVDRPWFNAWVAGLLSDLVGTLDPMDPWRNTSLGADGNVTLPDGSKFGTWENAGDIHPYTTTEDPADDIVLSALVPGLPVEAARLWCASQEGLVSCRRSMERLEDDRVYEVADAAITWAMHRRRLFMGAEDSYIPVVSVQWARRAEKIIEGQAWDESGAARLREGSRVEPGTWSSLAG